jgi:hypothetical protein
MPLPYHHLAAGLGLHALAPRQVSFLAFSVANIAIDLETVFNLATGGYPVHAEAHTYLGGLALAGAMAGLSAAARRVHRLPDFFGWKTLAPRQVFSGAFIGAWSHVLLDSMMHTDIRPLAPFSSENVLQRILSNQTLHGICFAAGLCGLLILTARAGWARQIERQSLETGVNQDFPGQ